MDNFRNLTLKKEHSKDKVINDTKKFSIDSVKKIDTQLKEDEIKNPDKKRKQELSK